ncbi:streptomycin 6-kinase [Actinopolymorpha cephalotaxi]|uniref:Streptomycin 6-kinase n=1 Tax=Actinopolymorpha cephalotaxi TaxID=504797 RepID=A0A1I2VTC0_9ACTN|nr:aminoglycoside phosphotransferase family protein [Actinopolymorpha cephalotaxi]NYH83240.1 streptomycin 6-kinase [Actinopolymorpha cephalotaxi]SFG90796.1 streptomycin 6-kinase [Actinopolymorpha cephalotaxi]
MRIVVPPSFVDERVLLAGPDAHTWLDRLPDLVAELARQWAVEVLPDPPRHGANSLVFTALHGSQPCVLKVCWDPLSTAREAEALRAWDGRGIVRLLAARPEDGALLLERLDAGRSLADLELYDAAGIAGGLLRRLTVPLTTDQPLPAGTPKLADLGAEIAATAHERQRALGDPVPARWIDRVAATARDLAADAGTDLVHADLHYGNVLAADREPWLAIDPKPVAGDPEFAVPELMWTRVDEAPDAWSIRRLLSVLTAAGGLDPDRARAWAIVRAVDYWLWGLDVGLTIDPPRCERVVAALV